MNGLREALESFLESLKLDRAASDRTIEAYRRDLLQLAAFLGIGRDPRDVSPGDLTRFLSHLHAEKNRPASIARKVSALRQFFKFCLVEKHVDSNPADLLRSPSQAKRLPKFLGQAEVEALLKAADEGLSSYRGELAEAFRARDRAMLYLLYATGLRVSELVGLRTHELETEMGYVRVRGKGEKERIVPFAPVAGDKLIEFRDRYRPLILTQPKKGLLTSEWLFPVVRGNKEPGHFTRQGFWKTLKSLALQAGVTSAISPHVLRHSFATHLLHSGMSLRSIQMLLGHSDLSTTQIYAHLGPEHLKAAHRKFHPRGD